MSGSTGARSASREIPPSQASENQLDERIRQGAIIGQQGVERVYNDMLMGEDGSKVVIVICPELQRRVREIAPGADPVLIENAPGADDAGAVSPEGIRERFGIARDAALVVYTGTFEAYQGLDLLFDAAATVGRQRPDVRFLLAGGTPPQVDAARAAALRESLSREDQELLVLRVDKRLAWNELAQILHEGDAALDAAGLRKEAARLRKRFQIIKQELMELGRREGLVGSREAES